MKDKLFSVTKNDFIIEFIRGSGPGWQHRNKCSTGVRLTHIPSKATATATDSKSQIHNKENAFKRLIETNKFKVWLQLEICKKNGTLLKVEDWVEQQMNDINFKIETKDDEGKWKLGEELCM